MKDPMQPMSLREQLMTAYRFIDRNGIKMLVWFAAICFLYAALCFTFILFLVIASQ